ncbi:MAG: hypothetical protein GXO57_03885 [Thermodesulfobacteria bacterium]|nr:hypothetical protein [Thermodesulfobacteriota bacterium]
MAKIRKDVKHEVEVIIYEGGEIPEIWFWNCYFHLTSPPPEGKGLTLSEGEIKALQKAVVERYLIIIQRDLTFEYINKRFYRGIARATTNIRRLRKFLEKTGLYSEYEGILRRKIKRWFKRFKDTAEANGKKLTDLFSEEEIKEFKEEVKKL